ncbi:MAG: DUF116 domain-containing protein [Halobacteriota archaeon]|nr:DUF116 domain-containing protein [Halobacteriota archaeon]
MGEIALDIKDIGTGLWDGNREENELLEIEFHNSIERERFEMSSPLKRLLILPHCMKRASSCKGNYSESGFNCVYCDKSCPTFRLKTFAEVLGYRVLIAPGTNILKKYLDAKTPEGIVYVACYEELVSGLNLIRSKRPEIPVLVKALSKTGCSNTSVDVDKVKNVLRIPQVEQQEL